MNCIAMECMILLPDQRILERFSYRSDEAKFPSNSTDVSANNHERESKTMTGTPQTIAVLMDQVQNVVATLKARTGDGKINLVTAPEYGADPTGVADSTAAFAAALAGPSTAIVPPGVYRLSNLVMPSGSSLVGFSAIGYGNGVGVSATTLLVAFNSAATRVINVDGAANISIVGLQIDCDYTRSEVRNANCDGVTAGSTLLNLRDVTIRKGRNGLGGTVAGGTGRSYSAISHLDNCQFFDCAVGLSDVVDGWVNNCYFTLCSYGARLSSNSGTVTFTGCRVEWNTVYGMSLENCSDFIINSTTFDRNSSAGLSLSGTYMVSVGECYFRRNGRNDDADSCHLRLNSASHVLLNGCLSRHGTDDGGSGNDTPDRWVRETGQSYEVAFTGNDLSGITNGAQTLAAIWSGNLPIGYAFTANLGLPHDQRKITGALYQGVFYSQSVQTIACGPTFSVYVPFEHDPIVDGSGVVHKLRVTARNQSTGTVYSAEYSMLLRRQGGTTTISQSAASGVIGTAGYIAFGSGTVWLSWSNVAADGSSYSLTIYNASTTAVHTVEAQIL